ncbi:MAG: hypothetical protein HY514_01970 [Candidatus Aenigmarchaeota archaeon]|nr:hypothetical protein [Candidatus Aenigmarchaeota archaeon]
MARKNDRRFVVFVIIVVIILIAGFFVFSYRPAAEDKSVPAAPAVPATGQPVPEAQYVSEERLQKCNELGSRLAGQGKTNFIDTCMKYIYKFCFGDAQCGPYQCINNKCEVE